LPVVGRWSSAVGRVDWSLATCLLLALLLRLALWSQPLHQPANDEIEYVAVARDLLAGRGWQLYEHFEWLRAPLYPLFLAGSLWLSGGDLHRAALPGLLLSVANVALCYRLTLALAGRRAAYLAGLLWAVLWTNATFASLYMAETLWSALFLAGLLALARADGGRGTKDEGRGTKDEAQRTETPESSTARQRSRAASAPPETTTPSPPHPTPPLPRVAVAGLLLGLATLTRSATLLFLPLVGLWLLAQHGEPDGGRRARLPGLIRRGGPALALFGLAAALTVAPWTLRNWLAYGRFIPVETGLAYNVWAFNEPREDLGTISRTLADIRNPGERSDYAVAKGLARLREDPAILLRKLWPNWVYLWRVKPIQDRFLQEFYYADVPLPLFAAALALDDALYLLIALAALAGLLGRAGPRAGQRRLCLAWLAYLLATVLLTHGEARYRHFLFPVLIPFAAAALARPRAEAPGRPLARALPLALGGLLLYTALASYPWDWAGKNLGRGWYVALGDLAWTLGRPGDAQTAYLRAIQIDSTADGWLRVGAAALARGDSDRALRAYHNAAGKIPLYIVASTRLGDLLRTRGDLAEARRAFAGSYASLQEVTDWAWRELRPPPRAALDVGDGLDFGYVGGVHPAEQLQGAAARWTDGRGLLRLEPPGGAEAGVLELRLAAPHPDPGPVAAAVCAAGRCWPLLVGRTWRVYALPLPPGTRGPLLVEIRSPTFQAPDGRSLGLQLDSAALKR
jgi:tetratricopeptide (TPR) repeat protein